MEMVCRICGRKADLARWQPGFEEAKEGRAPTYICPACEDRVRADARRQSEG